MRIVFMGTPDFAVPSLEALQESAHELVGVVSTPDRRSGRGRKAQPSPVKKKALEFGLPLLQPEDLKEEGFLRELREWGPELQVVVAFRLLPRELWSLPPKGTINLHASLLPAYRGAAPIQRALMNGETETGVTTFFIDEGMDRGSLLLQEKVRIGADTTAGELHDRLMQEGAEILRKTVEGIAKGELKGKPQKIPASDTVPRAPKIEKADRILDPGQSARRLHDRIRALSPYPGIQVQLQRNEEDLLNVKLLRSHVIDEVERKGGIGELIRVKKEGLFMATAKGTLQILELQPAGKKAMSAEAFLRGYRVEQGDRFLLNPP